MSATLPNLDVLARWLEADLYRTDFRPVPLTELVKIGAHVYDRHMTIVRSLTDGVTTFKGDDDHVIPLCLETINMGKLQLQRALTCIEKSLADRPLCDPIHIHAALMQGVVCRLLHFDLLSDKKLV